MDFDKAAQKYLAEPYPETIVSGFRRNGKKTEEHNAFGRFSHFSVKKLQSVSSRREISVLGVESAVAFSSRHELCKAGSTVPDMSTFQRKVGQGLPAFAPTILPKVTIREIFQGVELLQNASQDYKWACSKRDQSRGSIAKLQLQTKNYAQLLNENVDSFVSYVSCKLRSDIDSEGLVEIKEGIRELNSLFQDYNYADFFPYGIRYPSILFLKNEGSAYHSVLLTLEKSDKLLSLVDTDNEFVASLGYIGHEMKVYGFELLSSRLCIVNDHRLSVNFSFHHPSIGNRNLLLPINENYSKEMYVRLATTLMEKELSNYYPDMRVMSDLSLGFPGESQPFVGLSFNVVFQGCETELHFKVRPNTPEILFDFTEKIPRLKVMNWVRLFDKTNSVLRSVVSVGGGKDNQRLTINTGYRPYTHPQRYIK